MQDEKMKYISTLESQQVAFIKQLWLEIMIDYQKKEAKRHIHLYNYGCTGKVLFLQKKF